VDSWQEVIVFNVRPVGVLAFPSVRSREPESLFRWHDVTVRGNLPLDRLRLASLLDEANVEEGLLDGAVATPDITGSPRTLYRTAPQRHPPARTPASNARRCYATLRCPSECGNVS
jgi:hypothetical protein